jgi:hypothetical protein
MSKRKEAVLFTVWGSTIFCLAAASDVWQIGILLIQTLYTYLPRQLFDRLETSWMGGDWPILLLTAAVLGAIFGFTIWLVYRRFPEQIGPYLLPAAVALVVMGAVCVVFPAFPVKDNTVVGLAVVAALTIVLESLRGKTTKLNPPSTR